MHPALRKTTVATFRMATTASLMLMLAACQQDLTLGTDDATSPESQLVAEASMRGPAATIQRASVIDMTNGQAVAGAKANLIRNENGVAFTFQTDGLEKGHVYTMWWVIWNNPDECATPGECADPDLFNPAVQGTVMYAGGRIAGRRGMASFGGHLREGEITTLLPIPVPPGPLGGDAVGLVDSRKADIFLVLRTHGPKVPKMVRGMLKSYEGGCTPETSFGAGSGSFNCADIQVAIFPAP